MIILGPDLTRLVITDLGPQKVSDPDLTILHGWKLVHV